MADDRQGAYEARSTDIAIVGMAVRFPGAPDVASFWRNLEGGVESIARFSRESLLAQGVSDDAVQDPTYVPAAAVLDDIELFDAGLFGIGAREAELMDPQHRIFLELAWNALEDAGYCPRTGGANVGVFAGCSQSTYLLFNLHHRLDPSGADFNLANLVANDKDYLATRVAYKLNLAGPAVTVQSACSTSLVASHMACQSLLGYECDMALAGGITVRVPHRVGYLQHGGSMLSPDGHCRPFDRDAAGTLPGSGAGIVVLKRLEDAVADGDHVRAVIRGSAMNNDGSSKIGFTAPNVDGQISVIEAAWEMAEVAGDEIGYIESHGTGTALGDPIEIAGLTRAFGGKGSRREPCPIGSVKSNFGHLECAAGIAGLTKAALTVAHGVIPPSLHFTAPNAHIDFTELPVRVVNRREEWPKNGQPRRAGVSSFGFGGTNCHIVVEEPPALPRDAAATAERTAHVLTLSATSEVTLRALADRLHQHLGVGVDDDVGAGAGDPASQTIGDVCFTANCGRVHLSHRLAVAGADRREMAAALAAFRADRPHASLWHGVTAESDDKPGARADRRAADPLAGKVAFLYTGQGAQYPGMGRALYRQSSVFRDAFDRCDAVLRQHLGRSILSIIHADDPEHSALLGQTAFTQPALVAIEIALTELWRSWGVSPAIVMGHSVGEYTAAWAAGALGLEDVLALIAQRGRMMQELPPGAMASLRCDEERAARALDGHAGRVVIAAVNGPRNTVLAGPKDALDEVCAGLEADGVPVRRLDVSHAFHSPMMQPMLASLGAAADRMTRSRPTLPIISNLDGAVIDGERPLDGAYWQRHTAQAVRFADGLTTLRQLGYRVALEIGPAATLCGLGAASEDGPADHADADPGSVWIPSLRKSRDPWSTLMPALGQLYTRGVDIDWAAVDADHARRRVPLPTYPFDRQRCWIEPPRARPARARANHPLLGEVTVDTAQELRFEVDLGDRSLGFLRDHQVKGTAIFPATGYVEAMRAAARAWLDGRDVALPVELHDVEFLQPLPLGGQRSLLQTVLTADGEQAQVEVFAASGAGPADTLPWTLCAQARAAAVAPSPASPVDREALARRCPTAVTPEAFHDSVRARGMEYGPAFRGLRQLARGPMTALGQVALPPSLPDSDGAYRLHPALFDACLQVVGSLLPDRDAATGYLPISMQSIQVSGSLGAAVWSHATLTAEPDDRPLIHADVRIFDDDGQVIATIERLGLLRWRGDGPATSAALNPARWRYIVDWPASAEQPDPSSAPTPGSWIIVDAVADSDGDDGEEAIADRLARHLGDAGCAVHRVAQSSDLAGVLDGVRAAWGVVHLAALGAGMAEDSDAAGVIAAQRAGLGSFLTAINAVIARGPAAEGRLLVVTRQGQAVQDGEVCDPAHSALWGMSRVLNAERPELAARIIDLPATGTLDSDVAALCAELGVRDGEGQVAWRDGQRHAARLVREPHSTRESSPYTVEQTTPGLLAGLQKRPREQPVPGPGEVLIAVRGAAINFRDVLRALDMMPGLASPLGDECAGVVVALGDPGPGTSGGDDRDRLSVGDSVVALASGAFSSHVVAPVHQVVRCPRGMDARVAAALPIVFMTVHHAFEVARLQADEIVLVHSAAGGVGQAAVQLAQARGARVFATAGSEAKRELLRRQGCELVMDSRTTGFRERILEVTEGRGVDVVLNSISGDAIPASLAAMAGTGRFIELGKIGVWDVDRVREAWPDIDYAIVDLGQVQSEEPERCAALLREVMGRFEQGEWTPPPLRVFDIERIEEACRYMQKALHVGKITLAHRAPAGALAVAPDATYLITGGLGGLGLAVAEHLASRGARTLVLVGRRPPDDAARAALASLEQRGVQVHVRAVDVTQPDSVQALVRDIDEHMAPLRGVIHAAGVLEDGVLGDVDHQQLERVLAPKTLGSWNLHRALGRRPLDFFVLCSSVSALLGAPGQAAYAAANSFLGGLARYRWSRGLPALAVDWGRWAVGMSKAMSPALQQRADRMGIAEIPVDVGMELLDELLAGAGPRTAVAAIDWSRLLPQLGDVGATPYFGDLAGGRHDAGRGDRSDFSSRARPSGGDGGNPIRERLTALPATQRARALQAEVATQAAHVLGIAPDQPLDPDQPLHDLGLDSLMAVELRNTLSGLLGTRLPSTLLFDHPSIAKAAEYLGEKLFGREESEPADSPASAGAPAEDPAHQQLVEEIEGLSSDQLLAVIEGELDRWKEE